VAAVATPGVAEPDGTPDDAVAVGLAEGRAGPGERVGAGVADTPGDGVVALLGAGLGVGAPASSAPPLQPASRRRSARAAAPVRPVGDLMGPHLLLLPG
jgi:hypothetical protein